MLVKENLNINLSLPEPQVIELDDQDTLLAASSGFAVPQKIYSDDGIQAFLSHTQNFVGREGALLINLKSPLPSNNAENLTYAFILNAVFRKKHRTIYQRAYQRNGVRIFSDFDPEGNTAVSYTHLRAHET